MEKETVIKALEQEIHLAEYVDSSYCDRVAIDLMKDALALIKELTEENERLSTRIVANIVIDDEKLEEIKNECLERVELDIKAIKADTVREFAERLKAEWCCDSGRCCEHIDEVANEILNKNTEE